MAERGQVATASFIPIRAELIARTNWFIALRWLAVGTMPVGALAAQHIFGFEHIHYPAIYVLAAVLLASNCIYWAVGRRMARRHSDERSLRWAPVFAHVQISIDLLILTALIHFTGGFENPFVYFYVFHVIIASILLPRPAAFAQATWAVVLFATIAVLEHTQVLAFYTLRDGPSLASWQFLVVELIAFTSMVYVATYLASSIMDQLRQKEEQFDRTCREVRALEQTKSQLMRVVAHELRSPAAAVESVLTAILSAYGHKMEEPPRQLLARAIDRVAFLTKLVNDLLVFSREQALGRAQPQHTQLDLARMVHEVVEFFRPRAAEEKLSLSCHVDDVPGLLGEEESIKQLLHNLISNAVSYTPQGGSVDVKLARQGRAAVLTVSDTGIGIPHDDLPNIFTEFHRSPNARKFVVTGTGLGLAIAKAVVERHGGRISVDSREGQGTTFRVELPLRIRTPTP